VLPVEILPVQESIVLRARGSELLILPHHVQKLKGLSKPRDFSQYFRGEALVNRPARKLFEAWLRKDHTLWPRLYQVVHKEMNTTSDDAAAPVHDEAPKAATKAPEALEPKAAAPKAAKKDKASEEKPATEKPVKAKASASKSDKAEAAPAKEKKVASVSKVAVVKEKKSADKAEKAEKPATKAKAADKEAPKAKAAPKAKVAGAKAKG